MDVCAAGSGRRSVDVNEAAASDSVQVLSGGAVDADTRRLSTGRPAGDDYRPSFTSTTPPTNDESSADPRHGALQNTQVPAPFRSSTNRKPAYRCA